MSFGLGRTVLQADQTELEDLKFPQDLKFPRVSKNAVMTQIWVALCIYLLLACLKFVSQIGRSVQPMLWLLQPTLFEWRDLLALLQGNPLEPKASTLRTRLQFS